MYTSQASPMVQIDRRIWLVAVLAASINISATWIR